MDIPVHVHLGVDAGVSPSADTVCRTLRTGPQRRSLGARRLRRGFAAGSPSDSSSTIAVGMDSIVHVQWLAVPGCLQGRPVQTGPAHVAASPTTPPVKWLPATPLVAPTENIRVFSRWSPRAILLAPIRANIQPWFKRAFVANQDAPQDDSPPINRVGPRSRCCVNEVCTPSSCLRGDAREVLSLRQCGAETHHPAR